MTIERMQVGENTVVRVAGRMDAESAPQFQKECEALAAAGAKSVIADLSCLTYVSSMGLACFVSVHGMLRKKGGELRICGLSGLVRQVFEITNLDQVFPLHESVESALMKG